MGTFDCICPPSAPDPESGLPRAVRGCPAHRARWVAQELSPALDLASQLRQLAEAAGLVVNRIKPQLCQGRYDCFLVDLRVPGGLTWIEASHESEDSIREVIALYAEQSAQ